MNTVNQLPVRATARPAAHVTIEPRGRGALPDREHVIKLVIDLAGVGWGEPRHNDKLHVMQVARSGLAPFAPTNGGLDRRRFSEVSARPGSPVTGVEGTAISSRIPTEAAVTELRTALSADGYRVTIREMRGCSHSKCDTEVLHPWNQPEAIPSGWFRSSICGKHQYRACSRCKSVYVMSSVNSGGHAPSVGCSVCGGVLIEWGGSKVWTARLVARGDAGPEAATAGIAAHAARRDGDA